MSDFDTLIIGAGLSGLAAGVRLAYYGQRVCILERHTTIGGLNSFYRFQGRSIDVGLHAVTNFVPRGDRTGPLPRILRQLRLTWDDFDLAPQRRSAIVFPGARLEFSNDLDLLRAEIARAFPERIDHFQRLLDALLPYNDVLGPAARRSARGVVSETLDCPLLAEMLLCPVLCYGAAGEQDLDFGQFSMIFRSMFLEGLARPRAGIHPILKALTRRFKQLGGQLRLRCGVARLAVQGDRIEGLETDDGQQLAARQVLSSAGWVETLRLCGSPTLDSPPATGRMSLVESISVLKTPPEQLGFDLAVLFFSDGPQFEYREPAGLIDSRAGVICSPNNYAYERPLDEGLLRISMLASPRRWEDLAEPAYRLAKEEVYGTMLDSAGRFIPRLGEAACDHDVFTPRTIRRFTGHDNGALYGTPDKRYDGTTHLRNLFLCGNDQGLVGIVGAMMSGITVANRHLLER